MEPELQGSKTLQPFSPRWTDPELLEKTLVGRLDLVDRLEQLVLEGAGGPNKYQRLIVGPRGSGKTHVLRVLHYRLWRNAELKNRLLIIYLLEDELGVASFLDFLVRLLKAILAWYPENTDLVKGLDELYDLPANARQRRAIDLLLETAGTRDLLIIMENLGITFDETQGFGRKGQQALRDLVQQHPRFMIFASAQALLDGISQPSAPFYEFFTIARLKRLSLEEASELLRTMATAYGKPDVVEFLATAQGQSRVRAIYDFTGGNHRLLVTFYDFLAAESVAKVSDAFLDALKPLKPYYQEQMRALSAQQQKIVQFLSLERTPRSVKDIARGCLATSNTVSSQLKALSEKSFVERLPQGRESYYEISETLFRICYESDLDHQGAPTRLFVDFLGNFYTAQELETRARGFHLLARAISADAPAHEREAALCRTALQRYYQRQFDASEGADTTGELDAFFSDLSARQAYDDIISFAKRLGESKDPLVSLLMANAYVSRGKVADACAVLRKEVQKTPQDPDLHAGMAILLLGEGDTAGAEASCRRALDLDQANPWARSTLLGVLLRTGRYEEALTQIQNLTNGPPGTKDAVLKILTSLKVELTQNANAQEAMRSILPADPISVKDRLALARLLALVGHFDEALAQFEAVTVLEPDDASAYEGAGQMLTRLGRDAEAEQRFRSALSKDEANRSALWGLVRLLNRSGRRQEELANLQQLEQAGESGVELWLAMGVAHQELGQLDKAELSFGKAFQLEPTLDDVLNFANALRTRDRLSEGEPMFRRAVEQWPDAVHLRRDFSFALARNGRLGEALSQISAAEQLEPRNAANFVSGGLLAFQSDDMVEAEKHLRTAVELDVKQAIASLYLGSVMTRTGRCSDAVQFLETAAAHAPDDSYFWIQLGAEWRTVGDINKAEAAFRRAFAINPASATGLAVILAESGRTAEAEPLLRDLVEREPSNTLARDVLAGVLWDCGRAPEAREQFRILQNLEPGTAKHFFWGGLAALKGGDLADAELQLRKATELDKTLTRAWMFLGHLHAASGNLHAATEDYESALKLAPNDTDTLFGLSSVLIPQGRVRDAAQAAARAIETRPEGKNLADGLQSNLKVLFSSCTRSQMGTYLEPVLRILNAQGQLSAFSQALSLAIFALLKLHESISHNRFSDTIWALENLVATHINASVSVRFLNVGIEYLKHQNHKALVMLSREERALFTKELGIAAAGWVPA